MLNSQELVNFITDKLNEIGSAWHDPFSFKLVAEVGEDKGGADICGILRTDSIPEYVPVPGAYSEGKYSFTVDLLVPAVRSNYQVLQVEQIVQELVKQNQDIVYQFTDGKGDITFTAGKTGTYQVAYGTADIVPVTFIVRVTYTENAVTSADKHWLLDGVEIPYLEESVTVEREGTMRNIFTEQYNKLLLTGQTKYYNFKIPYESAVWNKLQKEILNSSVSQNVTQGTYELKYYDGSAFTEAAPFTTKVKIFRSGKSSSARPDASAFDVTFTDYDGPDTNYWLGLLDFPFDMNGEDTRYFESKVEQYDYFEKKISDGDAPFVNIEAPNLDSLFITSQVYQKDAKFKNQFNLANKNYAVIKVIDNFAPLGPDSIRFFFYYITKATIGAGGKMLLDLRLDTVQTFFFDPNISFSDCMIERAHLNRFQETSGPRVNFIADPASKIFNAEEGMNFPKRLVDRQKLSLKFTGNTTVDDWLNENVAYWVYVFIDPTATYNIPYIYGGNDGEVTAQVFGRTIYPLGEDGATGCICYPIYIHEPDYENGTSANTTNVIKVKTTFNDKEYEFIPNMYAANKFEGKNADTSYYYTKKISIIPPFDFADDLAVVGGNLIVSAESQVGNPAMTFNEKITSTELYGFNSAIYTYTHKSFNMGLFFGSVQKEKELFSYDYFMTELNSVAKSEIIAPQPPNLAYNPKLNGQNFKELVITAANGDTFAYDIQKINSNDILFMYSEPIQPEITRYYMRLKPTGLYLEGTEENYTGLVGSTDNGLAFTNSAYAAFIANNKNFFMQSNLKIGFGAVKSTAGVISQAASGNIAGAVGSGLSAGLDVAQTLIDRSMTVDNMKNAPDQLKNANGNVIFNMFATDLGLYVEKYSALEGDLKTANDFMNLYGFTFNSIANVKDYAHIRKYHNYVKAQLQGITGNISNTARDDLRQRFANGIRFWNQDNISYQWENYELWLEDL
nr:MAG TPA: Major tail protein [Bacteriophage sp.]